MILIRQKTVEANKGFPGFDLQKQVLAEIIKNNPRAVIYVSNIKNWVGSEAEKKSFSQTAESLPALYFPTDELELKGEKGKLSFAPPLDKLKVIPGPKTIDNNRYGKDGVSRRIILSFEGSEMMHSQIAKTLNPNFDNKHVRGSFSLYESSQTLIDFRPMNSYPVITFEDILRQNYRPELLQNKIVIIGDDTGLDKRDYIYTPLDRHADTMTLSELHANMLETLIRDSAPVKAPDWLNYFFTILISILTVHVVLTLKPLKGILILLGTALGFTVFSYISFWPFGFWIELAHPYLAIFLCYYFFIPYRLIIENRRSWEYFQKHKLLSEVEQLKTNFIGMMSHDLKTPIARIQGMTEVISKDPQPLSHNQREALDTIKHSAEDLLKFISTILNYAKIESQGVELHLQAKDINEILKEVIRKNEFLAKLKHIQLITELEPLFALSVDPDLLKQVFSNLIENAIKYSPENSKILISSEETDNKIIIQVADQGMGISPDDLPNVFMKFFRSKNAKASPIKGSGLGLYLAKYFVELHDGKLSCESTMGQGSTFTVELPL